MSSLPAPDQEAARLLALSRHDRAAARAALAELAVEEQVALVCALPASERTRLLDLMPAPEAVIPALPEAELVFTAKAIGLADAGWLLEHATVEQIQACFDLDAWKGDVLDLAALAEWFEALADAEDTTLVRAAQSMDTELLYLHLLGRISAQQKPNDEGFEPEPGSQTLEGQFFYRALHDDDDLATITRLLRRLFEEDYWLYFRMMLALSWESPSENEEFALRWRRGRLEDLGFPSREEALAIYTPLRTGEGEAPASDTSPLSTAAWRLPVWLPALPFDDAARHLVFRAASALSDDERRAFFFAFIALANRVAVADGLPLGDSESVPAALEKAATLSSLGLEDLARRQGTDAVTILRRAPLDRLFRIGVSLDPDARPPVASPA